MSTINPVSENQLGTVNSSTQPYAIKKGNSLTIYNIKAGDKIQIGHFGEQKYLFVNNQDLNKLDNNITMNEITIHGEGLSQNNLQIIGESGIATAVKLFNNQNKLAEHFIITKPKSETEKTLLEKIKNSPVELGGNGYNKWMFKIKGTF